MLKNDAKYQNNWPQSLPNRLPRAPKSTSGPSETPFWGNTAAKTAQKELRPNILVPKVWFWLAFWSPKPLQIETKMRKMWYRKARRFLHWFFHGSGMVLGSFFYVFLEWKFGRSPKIDLAKKLTKHWPWRQNRGSVFWKYHKFLRKYGSKSQFDFRHDLTCFLAWFSEVRGPQNHWFLHVGHRFLPVNFD